MFKRIIYHLILILILCNISWGYGIGDRSSTRDTLIIAFDILDSIGSAVDDATGDSVFIIIMSPGGIEVYSDSMLFADGRITEYEWEDIGNSYSFRDRFSILDGSSTSNGIFGYSLKIHDESLDLRTSYTGTFQIVNSTFDALLDSAATAQKVLDSIQDGIYGQDVNIVSIKDDLENADSLNQALDGYDNTFSTLYENTNLNNFPDADDIAHATMGHDDTSWATDTPGDRIKSIDDDGAKEASLFDPAIDSVIINVLAALAADGLIDSISFYAWEELLTGGTHNTQNSAGKILRQIKGGSVIHDGTSDNTPSNAANSFSLETGGGSPTTSTIDNFYNHQRLAIVEGTGESQVVIISDYNGSNQVATVTPAFLIVPDATSVYEIIPGLVHAETQGGGYEGGSVWVSSSGSTGTQLYVDGTIDNPIDDGSFANAKTVADALGINTFNIATGSNITLATTYNNYNFIGMEWHLALGGQDLGHSNIHGANISGTATGSDVIQFFSCLAGSLTVTPSNFFSCGFGETVDSVTASAVGTYIFRNCYSVISGTVTPKFSLGDAVGNVNFGFRNYDGGMELSEIGSTGNDSVSIEGLGNLVLNASDIGGDLVIRGNWTIDSTAGGSDVTLTRDAALNGEYLTDLTWDEVLNASAHDVGASAGQRLRVLETALIIRSNMAQGAYGANNRIQLDVGASAIDGAYDPAGITIVGGTGVGQTRGILEYNGTTKVAYVNRDWKVNPDGTSEYIIFSDIGGHHVNEGLAQGGSTNTITLNTLADSNDGIYIGQVVFLSSGTGQDQQNQVTDYNGTSKVATMQKDWVIPPDTSTCYMMGLFQNTIEEINAAVIDSMNVILDSLSIVLDSLENQSIWVARAVNQTIMNDNILAMPDSILQYFTLIDGYRSKTKYNANADTVFVLSPVAAIPNDTIVAVIYYHIGGTAGDPPDSLKVIDWP